MRLFVSTQTAQDNFFPTPGKLAGKMLAGIDWQRVENVLEPSAGKGDLAEAAMKAYRAHQSGRRELSIDCIEIDPYLRSILKWSLCGEREREHRKKMRELDCKAWQSLTGDEQLRLAALRKEHEFFDAAEVHIIHDDFFTYQGRRRYDLILMNPPFDQGDLHLLKALEVQESGGIIVCLLNAETLWNPFTNTRKSLLKTLEKYDAQIKFEKGAFMTAERQTQADVAIVRLNIPRAQKTNSTIWERMEKAAAAPKETGCEETEIVSGDYIEQAICQFNVEVAASMELIREYEAIKRYISQEFKSSGEKYGKSAILMLTVGTESNYS